MATSPPARERACANPTTTPVTDAARPVAHAPDVWVKRPGHTEELRLDIRVGGERVTLRLHQFLSNDKPALVIVGTGEHVHVGIHTVGADLIALRDQERSREAAKRFRGDKHRERFAGDRTSAR